MKLCPHHAQSVAGAQQAISSHRRHKIAASVARSIAKQCPACIRLTKESA